MDISSGSIRPIRIKNYEQALNLVTQKRADPNKFGSVFQAMVILGIVAFNPVVGGIIFLEKEPDSYFCKNGGSNTFEKCQKHQICQQMKEDPSFEYKPDYDDPDYLDNWIIKFDLLCKEHKKENLMIYSFFIGAITGLIILPKLADSIGRKVPFILTLLISIIAQIGLIVTDNFDDASMFMVVLGFTFPGKYVVGINYLLELIKDGSREQSMINLFVADVLSNILITIYYDRISRNILPPQIFGAALSLVVMIYFIFCAPESPKYLYSKSKFDQCREALRQVRQYNCGSDEQDPKASRKFNFIFDKEAVANSVNQSPRTAASSLPDLEQEAEALLITSSKADDANRDYSDLQQSADTLPPNETIKNIVTMTIMWTVCSFSSYSIFNQLKYVEGHVITNAYYTYGSDLLACVFGGYMYLSIDVKATFACAYFCSFVGVFYVFWIDHTDDVQRRNIITGLLLLTKFGITCAFLTTYQTSFHTNIFPQSYRASAIGVCNIIARTVTLLAPTMNDLQKPTPLILMMGAAAIGLISSFFINDKSIR